MPGSRRRRVVELTLLLIAAGAAAFWWLGQPETLLSRVSALFGGEAQEKGAPSGPQAIGVRLAEVREGTAVEPFETSATVVPAEEVTLSSEVAGRVQEVFAQDGARLEKDDPVVRFDAASERLTLQAARAELSEAEAALSRAEKLYEDDVAAESRVETARAAAETARAEVARAEQALDDRTVRAPFAGRVGFVDLSAGAYLAPGEPIARLQTTRRKRLRFDLPLAVAREASDVSAVEIADRGEDCAVARVVTISPVNDPESRTRTFEAALPEACGLRLGAFVTVSVEATRREGALLVPHEAVVRDGFEATVYRAEEADGGLVARAVLVELGTFWNGTIEVREGISAGDRIVASGVQKVRDGAPIRPVDGEGGGPGS